MQYFLIFKSDYFYSFSFNLLCSFLVIFNCFFVEVKIAI